MNTQLVSIDLPLPGQPLAVVLGFLPSKDLFTDVLSDIARRNSYHPIKDYLGRLEWDGVGRVGKWLVSYAGAEDNEFICTVGRLFLIACVRRIEQPGCKFDELLVLVSNQGTDKSTALSRLVPDPDWFDDNLSLTSSPKDVLEMTQGKWIVEIAELQGMGKRDNASSKALLSRRRDRARLAYDRFAKERDRSFVPIASVNPEEFALLDPSGNRRYWPVTVKRFDVAAIERDRDQIWAEAYHLHRAGESIRLDPKLWALAAEHQERVTEVDPWESLLEPYMGEACTDGRIWLDDLFDFIGIAKKDRTPQHGRRLTVLVQRLGWARSDRRDGIGKQRKCLCKGPGSVVVSLPMTPIRYDRRIDYRAADNE